MDLQAALQAVEAWPLEDQLQLVFQVWDRIVATGWESQVGDELCAELNRRLAAHQANPTRVLTWEQVVAHVKTRK